MPHMGQREAEGRGSQGLARQNNYNTAPCWWVAYPPCERYSLNIVEGFFSEVRRVDCYAELA